LNLDRTDGHRLKSGILLGEIFLTHVIVITDHLGASGGNPSRY
jgi:hypothetical protein